jgi:hypothetical protein
MRKINYCWAIPLGGAVLFNTAAAAELDQYATDLHATNRLTLSLRFGLNISSSFKGVGFGIPGGAASGNGQVTPDGSPYNYSDGYVLTDSTGNFLGFSSYWGYDNASQYNPAANTFTFHNSTSSGILGGQSGGSDQSLPGVELTYDRELGTKENWHDMHYGIEGAVNYLKTSFNNNGISGAAASTTTDVYQFGGIAGNQPAPGFQGRFSGNPGDPVIVVPAISSTTASSSETFLSQDQFDGNLWGFRLGPYVEFPMSEKWSLHFSGGLALGLLDGSETWQQTLNIPATGTFAASGGGSDLKLLWGFYAGLDAAYQFNQRWGVEGGVQFQDIGDYSHSFSGRTVELDLRNSLFVQVGVTYSF